MLGEEKIRTQAEIHSKGFRLRGPVNYERVKTNVKTLNDATFNLGALKQINKNYNDKEIVLRALSNRDIEELRKISNYFYDISGIYERICRYAAFLYRYDWYIVPQILKDNVPEEKVMTEFNSLLSFLDNSHLKKVCGDVALEVIKNGAYYGYINELADKVVL